MTMTLIETKTLGTATAAIEFTSIPQTFTDLCVKISGRASGTGGARDDLRITINADTGSNYAYRRLIGYDSNQVLGEGSSGTPAGIQVFPITANGGTSNTFSNNEIYFPNYTSATTKGFSGDSTAENNSSSSWILGIFAFRYTTTSPITSIRFAPNSDFMVGSTISLYGILKGSDGIVVAS